MNLGIADRSLFEFCMAVLVRDCFQFCLSCTYIVFKSDFAAGGGWVDQPFTTHWGYLPPKSGVPLFLGVCLIFT